PTDKGVHPDGGESDPEAVARQQSKARPASARTILTDPAFWMLGLLFSIVISGSKGMVTNLAPLAIDQGIEASAAALLISAYSASGFISKLSFAAVADLLSPRILALVAFAGFAIGLALLSQASAGYWVIAAGVCLAGLFGGLVVPLKSLLAPRIFGTGVVGRAMGLLSTLSLCISFAAPPLFGLMFDLTGSYSMICMIFAGLTATAMLAVPYIRMHPKEVGAANA
ncbi:MAG: MFS transporter, partial [Novosphingobium sp.]|nr:MFS transporter [Novosphingobium sp.]